MFSLDTGAQTGDAMREIVSFLEDRTEDILGDVETLVRIESPSREKDAINRVQEVTERWFNAFGWINRESSDFGDILHVHIPGESSERIVLLAHMDTVYPIGSWKQVWRIEGDLAYGPGAYDMKAGAVQALWALRALQARRMKPAWTLDLLLTPDEEIGSEAALPLIQARARGAAAVLVLEAPYMNGDLKIARKGVGDYTFLVHGTAAHQGVEPEKGRNAIVSTALLIEQMIQLQDLEKGTTLGPNVIRGGTVSNVVPDEVTLELDLRIWSPSEAERVDAALHRLKPLDGTHYELSGGLNRPPMEPSDGSLKLFEKARGLAEELGFSVGAVRVGGGSDGNFTAQLAPTLDGFGAMGAHAHQKDLEYIHIPSLAPRTALLAGMLIGAS
jgi:glutamate carboxypeptidase